MRFRTELPAQNFPFQINHQTKMMLLGSCFTEHLGNYLEQLHFPILQNPFGIVYNPLSIAQQLSDLMVGVAIKKDDLFLNQLCYHHFDFHGKFSHPELDIAHQKMQKSVAYASDFLKNLDVLFISPGTAWTWFYEEKPVNNCHKIPAQKFSYKRLDVEDWLPQMEVVLKKLFTLRPTLQIVFTVSPVRHTNKGLIENNLSKAALLLGAAKLVEKYPQIHYLPVYEWVLDDLRDYRFFEADLVHPNALAVQYVIEQFSTSFFDAVTKKHIQELERFHKTLMHKPFFESTTVHQSQMIKVKAALQAYLETNNIQPNQRSL